jgi:GT2 family glycosyltransferase
VVVATRDRRASLLVALGHLAALDGSPPIVVVDNGSGDGTPEVVADRFPGVRLIAAGGNLGAAGRTLGARALDTELIAFCDDDSWWAPDALVRAAARFAAQRRLAALAARILVGREERLDPVCAEMAAAPIGFVDGVGPRVLGFLACGAVVRRAPFLASGGFHPRFGVGGEEELLALDLAAAGWWLAYAAEMVAHHHPPPGPPRAERAARQLRNRLWSAWLRRPARRALAETGALAGRAATDAPARRALVEAARGARWVARERRVVPAAVERDRRRLERAQAGERPSRSASAAGSVGLSDQARSSPTACRSSTSSSWAAAATGSQHASDSRASSSQSA